MTSKLYNKLRLLAIGYEKRTDNDTGNILGDMTAKD